MRHPKIELVEDLHVAYVGQTVDKQLLDPADRDATVLAPPVYILQDGQIIGSHAHHQEEILLLGDAGLADGPPFFGDEAGEASNQPLQLPGSDPRPSLGDFGSDQRGAQQLGGNVLELEAVAPTRMSGELADGQDGNTGLS